MERPTVGCYTAGLTIPQPTFLRLAISETGTLAEAGAMDFGKMHKDDPATP